MNGTFSIVADPWVPKDMAYLLSRKSFEGIDGWLPKYNAPPVIRHGEFKPEFLDQPSDARSKAAMQVIIKSIDESYDPVAKWRLK